MERKVNAVATKAVPITIRDHQVTSDKHPFNISGGEEKEENYSIISLSLT